MELHYIWINNFYAIRKKGINLSARFIIRYEEELKELIINLNPEYITNFFESPNISNVTAIIGQNGTGKSTVLEYIKARLPIDNISRVKDDILVYTASEDIDQIFIYSPNYITINIQNNTNLRYAHIPYDDDGLSDDHIKSAGQFKEIEYIYYSYFLDQKTEQLGIVGLRNISTNALLTEHRYRNPLKSNSSIRDRSVNGIDLNEISDLDLMMENEVAKAMQLLISPEKIPLPFEKPEELTILLDPRDSMQFTSHHEQFLNERVSSGIAQFISNIKEFIKSDRPLTEDSLITDFYISVLGNFLYSDFNHYNQAPLNFPFNFTFEETYNQAITRFFGSMLPFITATDIVAENYAIAKSEQIIKLLRYFDQIIRDGILIPVTGGTGYRAFKFLVNKETNESFLEFIRLYISAKGLTPFLTFKWRSLSTGQQSYLSFLSRIYHLKRHEDGPLKKNLFFLIDEGDAGYHPEWQRNFFYDIISFIREVFNDHNVQLIFTSNTPFLTSDLTNPHILFIEKRPDGEVVFHNKDVQRQHTFGANIYTLYSDAFYMDGVLIGQFAKNKINKIVQVLNDQEVKIPIKGLNKLIGMIGEPILRKKLEEMYSDKFGAEEEITRLKLRLIELENKNKKNDK